MKDEIFSLTTRIACPAAEVFAWHERVGALERLCPPWEKVEVLEATGGVRDGARVTVRSKVGPCWTRWEVEHRDYVAGKQFRDVQMSGPFARWEHLHRVEADGADACRLTDEIVYRLPGGAAGRWFGGRLARNKIDRLFRWRHATTRADNELAVQRLRQGRPGRVLIAGASGLVGRALIPFLTTQGHTVVRLVRRAARNSGEISWDPAKGILDPTALAGVNAVVNLAGVNVGEGRWTPARRAAIMASRVQSTRTLVEAMRRAVHRPEVFVCASATGIFGERGAEILTEQSAEGRGFLVEVCQAWEAEARAAETLGVRTVRARFGVVLTPAGGALAKLLPVFRLGLGGRIGSGTQWMSWISVADVVGAIEHAMAVRACAGAMNFTAPEAVTNAEFTARLGAVLRRPTVCAVPAIALRAALGEMAQETILVSARAEPERLLATGYRFRDPELSGALRAVLGR